ncbi:MAG: tetratricopeptide repeat protein [Planctomycetota bacterium]|nr:tetratricopeptide repeat protein [Planctomycetota bacterium]
MPTHAQESQDDRIVLRDYYSGNGLLNRGLHDLAANEYRKFLKAHPDHAKSNVARYGLAVCYFKLNRFAEAVPELETLVELDDFEFHAEVAMILGQSHHALGDYDKAASACRIVLEDHLDHALAPNAAVLCAEAHYRSGRFNAAQQPCDLFLATWSDHPLRERAELFHGLSDMARNEFADAADRFSNMLERYPEGQYEQQTSLMLAQCLHRTTGLRGALTLYQKVIAEASDEFVPDALYGLALLMHQQEDPQRAGELVDELLDRYPESALVTNASLLRGRIWFELGDYDKAYDTLDAINDLQGDHQDDAEYWMAKSELRLDEPEDAAQRFAEAIEKYPDSELMAQMMYDRAIALLRADDDDDALDALVAFQGSFADHELTPDAMQLTAATLHQQGKYDESDAYCDRFRQNYADHDLLDEIDFLAAENEFLTRDYEDAIDEYRSFLRRHEGDEDEDKATFRLGMAQYQVGQFDEAESNLIEVAGGSDVEEAFTPALLALGDGYFQRGQWEDAERYLDRYLNSEDDPASADDALLKLGLAFHRQDKRAESIARYDALIRDYPDSPHRLQAIFERGQALVAMDNDEDAQQAFEQVLALGEESDFAPHAATHLGSIALRAGDYAQAATRFEMAADAHTDQELAAEALFQTGQATMALQRFDEAEALFAELIDEYSFHDRRPQSSALRAIAMARQNKHRPALDQIAQVESNFSDDIDDSLKSTMYYEKAWCLRELDRDDEASSAYRSILELNRRDDLHLYAMLELAELLANDESYEGAANQLDRLLDLARENGDAPAEILEQASYRLGVCQFRMEQFTEAASTLDSFIETYEDSDLLASAGLLCGEAYLKTGRYSDASIHLGAVVKSYADSDAYGPALLRLGEATAALSKWARSEEVFGTYLSDNSNSELWFQAQFGIGYAQENLNRYDDAIASYRIVVDRHQGPSAARAQFQIGECLYALKRFDEAAAELLKVDILYAYPEWSAAALFEAGKCFEELANPVEARRQFEQVVNAYGDTEWARLAQQRLKALTQVNLPGHSGGR